MSISPILDVVLGLVFIYLVLSLTCTAVQEAIAQLFNLRAKALESGIRNMLAGGVGGSSSSAKPAARGGTGTQTKDPGAQFYDHPLIRSLYERSIGGWRPPSYVPARTFAVVLRSLIDERAETETEPTAPVEGGDATLGPARLSGVSASIRAANLPEGLKGCLDVLAQDVGEDAAAFKLAVSRWFDDAMERVSAGYKRRTQLIVFLVALFVVAFANADSIAMANRLSSDVAVREALVSYAESYAQRPATDDDPAPSSPADTTEPGAPAQPGSDAALPPAMSLTEVVDTLRNIGLPLGWPDAPGAERWWEIAGYHASHLTLGQLIGLLLSVFAVSLGAPFWFDLLNKIVNIRSAGRAPEEKPKSPEALPLAR